MRVLIVKTSSMGDILHTLPALSDAFLHYPDIRFDWVVEENFKEIPAWHRSVDRVIPVALRRWRKETISAIQKGEIKAFIKDLRLNQYDLIIDAQGLLKSILITLLARGRSAGLSWTSARESLASLFYRRRAKVVWAQHAVVRARSLFAQSLHYSMPESAADYGIDRKVLMQSLKSSPEFLNAHSPYYVFLHGTTWATKHWPESYWIALGKMLAKEGIRIQLLWGNALEKERAYRIAAAVPDALVMSKKLSLMDIAHLLAAAEGVVAVDTGLCHLSAALGVPTVSMYGPTDPKLCGAMGNHQIHLTADFACSPCFSRTCTYSSPNRDNVDPPCFLTISPTRVWESIQKLLPVLGKEKICHEASLI